MLQNLFSKVYVFFFGNGEIIIINISGITGGQGVGVFLRQPLAAEIKKWQKEYLKFKKSSAMNRFLITESNLRKVNKWQ